MCVHVCKQLQKMSPPTVYVEVYFVSFFSYDVRPEGKMDVGSCQLD